MERTYRQRKGFNDGIDRAAIGIFLRLSRNQVAELERRAKSDRKSLKDFLRDKWEQSIARSVPPTSTGSTLR